MDIKVTSSKEDNLIGFLEDQDFFVENLGDDVYKVQREGDDAVFLSLVGPHLYFQVDLGSIEGLGSEEFYFKLLDSNTDILPVSFAIDSSNLDDKRLLLVESREIVDLCDIEVLSVFDSLSVACDKAEAILKSLV